MRSKAQHLGSLTLVMTAIACCALAGRASASTHGNQHFAWVHEEDVATGAANTYVPISLYNVSNAGVPKIFAMRERRGEYVVTACQAAGRYQVQVVAYGPGNAKCKLRRASELGLAPVDSTLGCASEGVQGLGLRSFVSCTDADGTRVNSKFVFQISASDSDVPPVTPLSGPAAFVHTSSAGTRVAQSLPRPGAPSRPNVFNSSGGGVTISRWSAGTYRITFAGLGGHAQGIVQVTAVGSDAVHCKPNGAPFDEAPDRSALQINVRCFLDNTPTDSDFIVNYDRHVTRFTGDHQAAHVFASLSTVAGPYTPVRTYHSGMVQDDPAGINRVRRLSQGEYNVSHEPLWSTLSAAYVVASGAGSEHCKLERWGADRTITNVRVRCFDHQGNPRDSQFMETYQGTVKAPQ